MEKFVEAQKDMYKVAYKEIKAGKKVSHWIWYIFPQLDGLISNPSENTKYYSLTFEEAREFLNHKILGKRLRKLTKLLLKGNPKTIMGTDSGKLHSSMTLFNLIEPHTEFEKVLEYYNGPDKKTIALSH
jgi:uncharacterized protein (DUF1810 family)